MLEIVKFTILLIVILSVNLLLQRISIRVAGSNPKFKAKYLPNFISILNWLSFYGIVLLFLFTFSRRKWFFHPIYKIGDIEITVSLIIIAFMIVSLAHRLIRLFTKSILTSLFDYYQVDKGVGYTLSKVIYYTFMVGAIAFSFASAGINLSSLGAIFGVLGIGLGFGMRNVAGNFVSGIIILFERPFEIGEVIEVNGNTGSVERIRLRSTVILTAKKGKLIVPNQYFIEQVIKNRSGAELVAQVNVCVLYGTDTTLVKSLLEKSVIILKENNDGILNTPAAAIRFINFKNKSQEFLVELPVANLETKEFIESELRYIISDIFQEHSIDVPELFPVNLPSN